MDRYISSVHDILLYCIYRYEKLEAEATAGEERFEEIMKKWSTAKNSTIPQVCNALQV